MKRNLILITIDSLRADHCSFMDYKRKTTPTIDKLAKKSLTFRNCVAASLPTPLSMYTVFTSKYYLDVKKQLSVGLRQAFCNSRTLSEILSNRGYMTVGFNKNPYIPSSKGYSKGFKIYREYKESKFHEMLYKILKVNRDLADLILGTGIAGSWRKEYSNIIKVLKEVRRPYFLWVIILDVHIPYIPAKRKWSRFLDNYYVNYILRKHKWKNVDDFIREKLVNSYDDCILNADEFVKRILEDTAEDDPIIIIHADHGDGFGEHGFYHHPPILYEELIRVPLIIYNADVRGKVNKPVSLVSLAPTILELLDLENCFPTESFNSYSEDYVVSTTIDNNKLKIAVRCDDWKYIIGQTKEGELYNLKKDPLEQVNVVEDNVDIVKDLNTIANRFIKTHLERYLIENKIKNLQKKFKK